MSEQSTFLTAAVSRLFESELTPVRRTEAEQSGWCREFWDIANTLGLPLLLVDAAAGGFGGDLADACAVARLAGRHAVPAPSVEDFLGRGLMVEAGMAPPDGVITLAVSAELTLENGVAKGDAFAVPWGGMADHVLVETTDTCEPAQLLLLSKADAVVRAGHNLAGEPSDDLVFVGANPRVVVRRTGPPLQDCLATLRASQMAGALEAALELTVEHANQRVQFGKPIGQFQIVQQQLALMAEEAAAVSSAAETLSAIGGSRDAAFEITAAKLRANRAIDVAVPIAHQILGAMGFTAEHGLRRLTQRLLWWRSECGGDRYWATRLGTMVVARGAASLWPDLTSRTDAPQVVL
jgi:acyl-CoA dehydrogenase